MDQGSLNNATSENASPTAKVSEVQPTSTAYNSRINQSKPATTMTYLITTEVYTDKSAKINYPQLPIQAMVNG